MAALVADLGESKAEVLVVAALKARARERGEKLRRRARKLGVEPVVEEFERVTDIPFLGWVPGRGKEACPYAAAWLPRLARDPWFARFARLYCDINDMTVIESFTRTMSQRITKNVLAGDESCERIFFPKEHSHE